jgi:hypothetical protein
LIRSGELLVNVVFTEFVFKLLLQVLLCQLLIGVLLDEDGLLQVVHNLKDKDQLLLLDQLRGLQVGPDDLSALDLQLIHLEFALLVNAISNQEQIGLHSVDLLLHCGLELLKGVLGVAVGCRLLLETLIERVDFFFDVLVEVEADVNALALVQLEHVNDHLIESGALGVIFE